MRKPDREFSRLIAFRANSDAIRKLDSLAAATDRSRSAVLRLLLEVAELGPQPDICLKALAKDSLASG